MLLQHRSDFMYLTVPIRTVGIAIITVLIASLVPRKA